MNEETPQRKSYYAIIPAPIRYSEKLSSSSKLLFGEITALCNEKGFCWASNSYFAKLYTASPRSVSKWVAELENEGFIKVKIINGMNREIHLAVNGFTETLFGKVDSDYHIPKGAGRNVLGGRKKISRGVGRNLPHNNTMNTTVNNIDPTISFKEWFEKEIQIQESNPYRSILLEEKVKFIDWWTEKSPNAVKCKWEKRDSFDVKKRWRTWVGNVEKRMKPAEFKKQEMRIPQTTAPRGGGFEKLL